MSSVVPSSLFQESASSVDNDYQRKTGIVVSLGPGTDDVEVMGRLIDNAVKASNKDSDPLLTFRINSAHGTRDDHRRYAHLARQVAEERGIRYELLGDLAGTKFRVADMTGKIVQVAAGASFRIDLDNQKEGDVSRIGMKYQDEGRVFIDAARDAWRARKAQIDSIRAQLVSLGDENALELKRRLEQLERPCEMVFGDGNDRMVVESVGDDFIQLRALEDCFVGSGKGINMPIMNVEGASFTRDDRSNADFFTDELKVDWLVQSFAKTPQEVQTFIDYAVGRGAKLMIKVETEELLHYAAEVIDMVDGIMIGCGDLGVETNQDHLALITRELIYLCRDARKKVIAATGRAEAGLTAGERAGIALIVQYMYGEIDQSLSAHHEFSSTLPEADGEIMLSAESSFPAEGGPSADVIVGRLAVSLATKEAALRDPRAVLSRYFSSRAGNNNLLNIVQNAPAVD